MNEILKICTQKPLYQQKLSLEKKKFWKNGQTLNVYIMGGSKYINNKIKKYATKWGKYANINFSFGIDKKAEIRISFKSEGSWSYIGTDCLQIPSNESTMNFGWFDNQTTEIDFSGTILHEFGHALGCIHEHQSPASKIQWNRRVVLEFYYRFDPPWDDIEVEENVFKIYTSTQTQYSSFDKNSIMLYSIPNSLTLNNFSVGWNDRLSKTDKDFINKMYPFKMK